MSHESVTSALNIHGLMQTACWQNRPILRNTNPNNGIELFGVCHEDPIGLEECRAILGMEDESFAILPVFQTSHLATELLPMFCNYCHFVITFMAEKVSIG